MAWPVPSVGRREMERRSRLKEANGMRDIESAWLAWWASLGHVARTNRDKARIREAFEAGFLAASAAESRQEDQNEDQDMRPTRDRR
jgi:hypothetical protein